MDETEQHYVDPRGAGESHLIRGTGAGPLRDPESAPANGLAVPACAPRKRRWKPTAGMERALAAAVSYPAAATNKAMLSRMVPECQRTVQRWFSIPEFRAWWNQALLTVAQQSMGPAMMELERIIGDAEVPPSVKVRAIDTMLRHVSAPDQGVGHAVAAIIERWTGSGQLRLAARGGDIAVELQELGGGAPQPTPPPRDHWDPQVVQDAVQMGPATAEHAARRVAGHIRDEAQAQAREEGRVVARQAGVVDPTAPTPLGKPNRAPKIVSQGVGGSESLAGAGTRTGKDVPDFPNAADPSFLVESPADPPAEDQGPPAKDFLGHTYVTRADVPRAPRVGQEEAVDDHRLEVD